MAISQHTISLALFPSLYYVSFYFSLSYFEFVTLGLEIKMREIFPAYPPISPALLLNLAVDF